MHYNLHYAVTEEVSKLVTRSLLRLYDNHKADEKIFSKANKKEKLDKKAN